MRRVLKISALTLTLPALLIVGYISYILATGNFHPITPGEAYRSAQLDKDKLEYYIKQHHIKSILNLCGQNIGQEWYEEEIETSKKFEVMHFDLALSSFVEPTAEDVKKLLEIFRTAPRPILIHCKAGADRSGLVAAMWKVIVDKETTASAERQLTIWYGHIPVGGTIAMDRFYEKWNPTD